MKDLFSKYAADYLKFRPTYPEALYKYLASLSKNNDMAWDAGTGNGQAAIEIVKYYDTVIATDISEKQIDQASKHERILYRVCPAEKTPIAPRSADLTTVAQAFHWFKHEEFFKELDRVKSEAGAILAIWAYEVAKISPAVDRVVRHLYKNLVGEFWEPERRHIENKYGAIKFPYTEIETPSFEMKAEWTCDQWAGYLNTWSAVQTGIKKTGVNHLEAIKADLEKAWGDLHSPKEIVWPLTLKVFRVS